MTLAATGNILLPNFTFVIELAVFVALLLLLRRYVYPHIDQAITSRQQRIAQALQEAERARQEVERARADMHQEVQDARRQAQALLAQAQRLGDEVREELRTKGRADQEAMLERARHDLALERQQMLDEIRRQVVDLTVAAAARVLQRELDPASHARMAEEALQEVELRA